ncbi:MAG: YceI family protein [Bacteroidota bacterium]
MEKLFILSFIVLGLSSFLVNLRANDKYYSIFNYLLFVLIAVFSLQGFKNQEDGLRLMGLLIPFVSVHLVLNKFVHHKMMGLVGILSVFVFLIFSNAKIEFQAYPLIFDFQNVLILPFLGALFPFLVHFKGKFLSKFFKTEDFTNSLHLMSIAFLIFGGLFFGSSFGIFLTVTTYFVSEMYLNKISENKTNFSFPLMILSLLLFLVHDSEIEMSSFLHQSTLLGLFLGAGIGLWMREYKNSAENSFVKSAIHFIIPLALIAGFTFVEIVKQHAGGLSAFTGIIIALLLTDKQKNKTQLFSLVSVAFAIILFAIPMLQPQKMEVKKNDKIKMLSTDKSKTPFDLDGKSLSEINGMWTISKENSKIDFKLGSEDARTEGSFKSVEGTFDINNDLSILSGIAPMAGFSTFNEYRDEGLMGEEYFNTAKFPKITFKNKSIKEDGDKYILSGDFEMKGVKQKMDIELKLIDSGKDAKGEFAIIVGKSSLDRSKHEMVSDPKIGDIVDFTFELELRK